jgi:hypothetical protein
LDGKRGFKMVLATEYCVYGLLGHRLEAARVSHNVTVVVSSCSPMLGALRLWTKGQPYF